MVDIIHRIGIKAPLAKVHAAISTVEGVAGWWTKETSGDAQLGGSLKVVFRSLAGQELGQMEFQLTELRPERVCWRVSGGPPEWLGTEVTFDLREEGGQTTLVFGHRDWREPVDFMAHCSMKWATFLLSLRQLVETGRGLPSPHDLKIDNWN